MVQFTLGFATPWLLIQIGIAAELPPICIYQKTEKPPAHRHATSRSFHRRIYLFQIAYGLEGLSQLSSSRPSGGTRSSLPRKELLVR